MFIESLKEETQRYEGKAWRTGEGEASDSAEEGQTAHGPEFMARVKQQLREIKNFKAAFVRA